MALKVSPKEFKERAREFVKEQQSKATITVGGTEGMIRVSPGFVSGGGGGGGVGAAIAQQVQAEQIQSAKEEVAKQESIEEKKKESIREVLGLKGKGLTPAQEKSIYAQRLKELRQTAGTYGKGYGEAKEQYEINKFQRSISQEGKGEMIPRRVS